MNVNSCELVTEDKLLIKILCLVTFSKNIRNNMLSVLNKGRVPVKLWTNIHEVESQALTQLTNLSTLPFVFKHIPVMPDVHVGKGATVGTVLPTVNAILPAAVGVDIGCGMHAMKLPYTLSDLPDNLSVLPVFRAAQLPHKNQPGRHGIPRTTEPERRPIFHH